MIYREQEFCARPVEEQYPSEESNYIIHPNISEDSYDDETHDECEIVRRSNAEESLSEWWEKFWNFFIFFELFPVGEWAEESRKYKKYTHHEYKVLCKLIDIPTQFRESDSCAMLTEMIVYDDECRESS